MPAKLSTTAAIMAKSSRSSSGSVDSVCRRTNELSCESEDDGADDGSESVGEDARAFVVVPEAVHCIAPRAYLVGQARGSKPLQHPL